MAEPTAAPTPAETVVKFERNVRTNLIRFALTGPVTLWVVREVHRALTPPEFGLWATLSLPAANYYLFDLGGMLALTRLVADARGRGAPREAGALTGSLVAIYAVFAALAIVVLALVPAPASAGLAALALAAAVVGLGQVPAQALLAGHERLDVVNLWMAVSTVAHAAAVFCVASRGVAALMGAQLVANLLALVGLVGSVRALGVWPAELAPARGEIARLAREMLAVWPAQMYGVLVMHGDKLVLSAVSGLAAAGQMDLIGRLPGYVRFLAIKVADPLLPAAARLHPAGEEEALGRLVGSALARTVWVWLLSAVGLALFAPEILALWLGSATPEVVLGLRLIAASFAVHSLTTLLWYYWAGIGRRGFALGYVLFGAALWFAGSLAGAHLRGIVGALTAHLVVSTVVSVTALALARPPAGALPRAGRALVRAIPAAAVAGAAGLAASAAGPLAALATYAAFAGAALAWFGRARP